MFYRPEDGHGLPHDPFKALIAPRPIGWISTMAADGRVNLAPYSFFNALSSSPPLVMLSSEGSKDSVNFARETGEFVINLVGRAFADKMNITSMDAPRGVSEFELAGLERAPSTTVRPPRVAGIPAALECKVTDIRMAPTLPGAKSAPTLLFGQATGIHIDDAMITADGLFDMVKAGNVARLGYFDYLAITETFQMRRPRWKDRQE
jgi:flavin reductase (DIM6/NTAB) family NADH-FMN oxidoreductase RutF